MGASPGEAGGAWDQRVFTRKREWKSMWFRRQIAGGSELGAAMFMLRLPVTMS